MNEWWDGPRSGFAEFDGAPHAFGSIFREDLDDWDPDGLFWLRPVTPEVLALALEHRQIQLRWSDAYTRGEVTADTPTVPADAPRFAEIAPVVAQALEPGPEERLVASARFRATPGGAEAGLLHWASEMEVRWTPVAPGGDHG